MRKFRKLGRARKNDEEEDRRCRFIASFYHAFWSCLLFLVVCQCYSSRMWGKEGGKEEEEEG